MYAYSSIVSYVIVNDVISTCVVWWWRLIATRTFWPFIVIRSPIASFDVCKLVDARRSVWMLTIFNISLIWRVDARWCARCERGLRLMSIVWPYVRWMFVFSDLLSRILTPNLNFQFPSSDILQNNSSHTHTHTHVTDRQTDRRTDKITMKNLRPSLMCDRSALELKALTEHGEMVM